jgi:ribokinase
MKTRVLNFGSINIDHVYRVNHFVKPGETLSCGDYKRFAGGKGLNQSIALARAGAEVYHAGSVNINDDWLKEILNDNGVNSRLVDFVEHPTGHAIIQVNAEGENSIVTVSGANRIITTFDINYALISFYPNDYLLVQNETNMVSEMISSAKAKGMKVAFNPSPITPEVLRYSLDFVDILVVNEIEAKSLFGETDPLLVRQALMWYPNMAIVLTLGERGAHYLSAKHGIYQPAIKVKAVDTTGAGDTFLGFFLAELIETNDPTKALLFATKAAAICVTRHGASDSIPTREEVER